MAFKDLTTTKKGDIGEEVVREFLTNKGYITYTPDQDLPHGIDIIAMKGKRKVLMVDIKTKASRNYYPDTGFDFLDYITYKNLAKDHNVQIVIAFVDEDKGTVYGGFLSNLCAKRKINHNGKTINYPKREGSIIYFPLEEMQQMGTLKNFYVDELKKHSSRTYEYNTSDAVIQENSINL